MKIRSEDGVAGHWEGRKLGSKDGTSSQEKWSYNLFEHIRKTVSSGLQFDNRFLWEYSSESLFIF